MRTARFCDSGEGGVFLQRPPWTEIPLWPETHPFDSDLPGIETPRRNMGPGNQWSDIIQRPPWTEWLTHASENITLPQTSFAGGKYFW